MPIRPQFRALYPAKWRELSREIRFERAGGRCEHCQRPHGRSVRSLPDGRWYDEAGLWRTDRGQEARWPDIVEYTRARKWRVILAAAHLDGDPTHNSRANLRALCQRCHLAWDRRLHRMQARLTILMRRALGDLLEGPYRREAVIAAFATGEAKRAGRRAQRSQKAARAAHKGEEHDVRAGAARSAARV